MKLIVGLGNPGKEYERTRHNVGFRVVDLLASRWQIDMLSEKFHAWFGSGVIRDERVVLLKPTTFMNRSGQAVQAAGKFYQLELADLLVISDDVAIDVGRLRVRKKGSAGGHNGLSDIIRRIGSDEFCRLRFGIGDVPGAVRSSHVLGRFSADEDELIEPAIRRCADAVETWIVEGADAAMNRFNVEAGED
ncbi:MAG: aminoacyl-tRNA hydrolase [Phycisphaerales bacterium]|nr:aminoacyl-tRNA hydrolase [Phycisphaerales bacterium]